MAFDPHYANVSLLLHCDGANGSTTLTDNSPAPKTFTANGGAAISTAQSKFGSASAYLNGTGAYFQTPASTDFAFPGDFTIEFWAWKSANGAAGYDTVVTTDTSDGSAVNGWFLELSTVRGISMLTAGSVVIRVDVNPNDSVWHHWAVTRAGSTVRAFKDGALLGTSTYASAIAAAGPFGVGRSSSTVTYPFKGYIDDLRITKGVARYTANFTPPTEPFPDTATAPALSAYAAAPTPLGAPATLAASIRQAWGSAASPLGAPAILAASGETFFARAAAATPLGAPLALARAVGAARVATAGPLGAGAALGQLVAVARAAASGPLGVPAVMARTRVYAQASAPSPLGVPVVRASVPLQAQGFNSTAFGTPSSAIRLQAAGFCTTSFGTPVSPIQAMPIMVGVSFGTPRSTLHTSVGGGGVPVTALARGWRNSRFGSPTALVSLQVQAHGWHGARFGQPVARQTLQAAAIAPATAFGTPAAQQQMRAQARGWQSSRFGTPLLRRQVNAEGFSATRFGTPTAKATFRAQAQGFRAGAFGAPSMSWGVRALPMSPSTRFGRPTRTRSTEC